MQPWTKVSGVRLVIATTSGLKNRDLYILIFSQSDKKPWRYSKHFVDLSVKKMNRNASGSVLCVDIGEWLVLGAGKVGVGRMEGARWM